MIFHASIPADDPERVARVLGELWQRDYFPFVLEGTFVVFANDGVGTQLEVAPRREEIIPAPEHLDLQTNSAASPYNAVHINIDTPLAFEQVRAIADREGWMARVCDRGGAFKVIEFWLENKFLIELMTAHEAERYRNIANESVWRGMLAGGFRPMRRSANLLK
jgi:hypothetical protein